MFSPKRVCVSDAVGWLLSLGVSRVTRGGSAQPLLLPRSEKGGPSQVARAMTWKNSIAPFREIGR
jgi:hypothetical protein